MADKEALEEIAYEADNRVVDLQYMLSDAIEDAHDAWAAVDGATE